MVVVVVDDSVFPETLGVLEVAAEVETTHQVERAQGRVEPNQAQALQVGRLVEIMMREELQAAGAAVLARSVQMVQLIHQQPATVELDFSHQLRVKAPTLLAAAVVAQWMLTILRHPGVAAWAVAEMALPMRWLNPEPMV